MRTSFFLPEWISRRLFVMGMVWLFLPLRAQEDTVQKYFLVDQKAYLQLYEYYGHTPYVFLETKYYYNELGQDTLKDFYYYAPGEVILSQKQTRYTYDPLTGYKLSLTISTRDSDTVPLTPTEKRLFYYRPDGHRDSTVFYQWDTVNNQWVRDTKKIYTYNDIPKISKIEYLKYKLNNWVPEERYVYAYDSLNRYSEIRHDTFDDSIRHAYVYYENYLYEYHFPDSAKRILQNYIDSLDEWKNTSMRYYIYHPSNLKYDWVFDLNWSDAWQKFEIESGLKYYYEDYDFPNILKKKEYYKWDGDRLVPELKFFAYSHDFSVQNEQLVLPSSFDSYDKEYLFNYKMDTLKYIRYDTIVYYQFIYTYELRPVLGTSSTAAPLQVHIFPNPVKDVLFIENHYIEPLTFRLMTTGGQVIFRARNREVINLSHLPKGLYIYQIDIPGKGEKTGLIIKE